MQAVNASPYHIHPIHSVLYRLPGKTIVLEKVNSANVSEGYASQNQRASSASQSQQCIDSFSVVSKNAERDRERPGCKQARRCCPTFCVQICRDMR